MKTACYVEFVTENGIVTHRFIRTDENKAKTEAEELNRIDEFRNNGSWRCRTNTEKGDRHG